MKEAHKEISETMGMSSIKLLIQGSDTRHNLLSGFRDEPSTALFATDSFWEGVDVVGESLESIIIARLPFKVPTVPIEIARREAIEKAGGNSFMEYSVPQAAIKLKQGFGRLIRHQNDRGTILILDNRIISKFYGKIFLKSLPDCRLIADRSSVLLKAFEEFYDEEL
jgi:ATP-dependent DNA helicase DinG